MPVLSTPSHPMGGGMSAWFLKPWVRWGAVGFTIVALGGTAWHFYRQSRSYAPRSARVSVGNKHSSRQVAESRNQPSSSYIPPVAKVAPYQPERSLPSDQARAGQPPGIHQIHPRTFESNASLQRNAEPSISRPASSTPVREERLIQRPLPAETVPRPSSRSIQRPTPQAALIKEMPAPSDMRRKVEAVSANASAQPDSATKMNAAADKYNNTPLLTDGRLRVHAIAWSPKPADRMAVINSRVIYEGDSMEDFTVVAIRPDDVVVLEKGKGVWRVEFGRP
jgi:Type II secretion system protein B